MDAADIICGSLSCVSAGQPQTLARQCLTCSGKRSAGCSGQAKKFIRLGLHDANLACGRGIHANVLPTKCSCLLLIPGQNSSLAAKPAVLPRRARDGVGGDGMGREGRTSPHCSISRSTAPFILPYVDLSMCSPMCHT